MKLQNIYKCKKYTKNENLNKTCKNKTRCVIYYDEICKEYENEKHITICNSNNPDIRDIHN